MGNSIYISYSRFSYSESSHKYIQLQEEKLKWLNRVTEKVEALLAYTKVRDTEYNFSQLEISFKTIFYKEISEFARQPANLAGFIEEFFRKSRIYFLLDLFKQHLSGKAEVIDALKLVKKKTEKLHRRQETFIKKLKGQIARRIPRQIVSRRNRSWLKVFESVYIDNKEEDEENDYKNYNNHFLNFSIPKYVPHKINYQIN